MKYIRITLISALLLVSPVSSHAFIISDGSGWATYAYIVKILDEAYKRYAQLQAIIGQGQAHIDYLRWINAGMDDISGLIDTLPIEDEKILSDLKTFRDAIKKIEQLYGAVPKSDESPLHGLHDETIAESLRVTNSLKEYAEKQELNANKGFEISGHMSPRGAARLTASLNAQILHVLTQILRVNGQMLKIQGESFALANKGSKDSVAHFNHINSSVRESLIGFSGDLSLPRF